MDLELNPTPILISSLPRLCRRCCPPPRPVLDTDRSSKSYSLLPSRHEGPLKLFRLGNCLLRDVPPPPPLELEDTDGLGAKWEALVNTERSSQLLVRSCLDCCETGVKYALMDGEEDDLLLLFGRRGTIGT